MEASDQSPDCAPLAALLYDTGSVPGIDELMGAAEGYGEFTVSHVPAAGEGWAEVVRDGLTFDLRGLSGGAALDPPAIAHAVGMQPGDDLASLRICPGPHLAGAQRLLPVIRVGAALAMSLSKIGRPRAICWIPARNAVAPELFNRAVKPWLEGGPFPAMALASLHRMPRGGIGSEGLKFLIGQEFSLVGDTLKGPDHLARVAVRLVDWLVAHGPVVEDTEVVLAGTGAVFLEAQTNTSIVARCA
ncbi:hypothetical protein [Novosphingobium sp. CECT 9465]|uniref:hypothetical protein n=1 Tax=Novosphingobium sp. CECT 9465 TaxID=2829794 RepID=UPI001E3D6B2F|nr:hypothetical protein [Novosphingobium sp. CECT 9465]CAH0497007.1 hypothetical protein NVSP9465_02057 [Novosphingobium sp. CECT 9465]